MKVRRAGPASQPVTQKKAAKRPRKAAPRHPGTLVLLRHGQSEWNLQNRFTGWTDVKLTDTGRSQAREAGAKLKGIKFDKAYTSNLQRANETLKLALAELGENGIPVEHSHALDERDYGDLTGKNKSETEAKYGKQQVLEWRRSFDVAPPHGESLHDTADRAVPYFEEKIMADIKAGKNVLVAAHGNSLRAIVKAIEHLTRQQVEGLEIDTAVPLVYHFDDMLAVVSRDVLGRDGPPTAPLTK